MSLEPLQRELAAIGASIGSNCRPCIEHHLAAGRDAGLSDSELDGAVALARQVRIEAVDLLSARIDELLGHVGTPPVAADPASGSEADELVALGVSVGANSHALLRAHVGAALEAGLTPVQVRSALKMAQYVQQKAAEITAEKSAEILSEVTALVAR